MLWLIFGLGAILFAIVNIYSFIIRKVSKWYGFISLSLTALTVCAFYSDAAARVIVEDWGGLMDILPTSSKALWFCVFSSIIINAIPLFKTKNIF